MKLITSFSNEGFELYGKEMVETFLKYNSDNHLTVYYEEPNDFPEGDAVEYKYLYNVPGMATYLGREEIINNGPNGEGNKNWRFNVFKFGRKAIVQLDALHTPEKFAWIDGDVTFKSAIPEGVFDRTTDDYPVAYMGRIGFHPCTSFVGFDPNNPLINNFVDLYEEAWTTKKLFKIPEWHDAYVFNFIRIASAVPSLDIAKHTKAGGSRNVFDMVFKFARHKKGQRKFDWCTKS